MEPEHVLLSGVVGSHAYGLQTSSSDIDRLGVFAAPTEKILGLHPPADSVVSVKPDVTYHEARKYVSLALKCNPTVTELLWLPRILGSYEVISDFGEELIGIRESFLSASYVRNAYLGYATQQFRRLENRGDGSFSSDTRKRTAKHARHLARLLLQGTGLWRAGSLNVRLSDPEWFRHFGDKVAAGDLDLAKSQMAIAERVFDEEATVLSGHPDEKLAEEWLLRVRHEFW